MTPASRRLIARGAGRGRARTWGTTRAGAHLILGAAVVVLLSPCATALARPKGGVLVVGDSLEVGTEPHLRRELPGVDIAFDHRNGRPSGEGVGVLRARLRSSHRVVVFDLGTNDLPSQPQALGASLKAARELAGDRCIVVATINRPPLGGVDVSGLNRVVRRFASETPSAEVVDWRAAAMRSASLLAPDGIHANPQGYAARGRLVADAVKACLESGGASADLPSPDDAPAPPRGAPKGRARARRPPPTPEGMDWAEVAALTPLPAVAAYVEDVARRVESASRGFRAALGLLEEPTLGGPSSAPAKP
jgi:lysophospholipase L1-like esterase